MVGQAAGFALLAALSPPALLIAAIYLGSARPRRTMIMYLAGATLVSATVAAILITILRAGGLDRPGGHTPRYGLRLGLGVLAIVAAGVVLRRARGHPHRSDDGHGLVARLVERPTPRVAFVTGVLVFLPSASYVAAVQVIATARASTAASVLAAAVIVAIDVAFAWLPLLGYLAAPDATARRLHGLNQWLGRHGSAVVVAVAAVVGVALIINGAVGLSGGA